jgi:predicted patatin/cPLA2 family phospholipase
MKTTGLIARRGALGFVLSACVSMLLSACSGVAPGVRTPPALRPYVTVLGLPNGRFYTDEPAAMQAEQELSLRREARSLGVPKGGVLPAVSVLSLSGGGDDGAFGSGLLVGWTAHGDRPQFKLVTGVSTGALIAPFAFLGKDYDQTLAKVYTDIEPSMVFQPRPLLLAALTEDALSDTGPLYQTISHYIDEKVQAAIAAEYEKGRLLLIQTTDLDAGRPIIWNIGAIAASGHPESLTLLRHIMLASASIPAAFPPVMFDVEANGQTYQELHVDGGAVSQAFLIPPSVNVHVGLKATGYSRRGPTSAYIVRNARLTVEWNDVEKKLLPIAGKAVNTMINYNGVGDLYRMYMETRRAGASFHLAYIGPEFKADHKFDFDPVYMRALYNFAYDKAARGYPWQDGPPGFASAAH